MRCRTIALSLITLTLLAGPASAQMFPFGQPAKKSLWDRLGGTPAVTAVVDDFVANVAADRRINRFFAKTNIFRLKRLLVEQICAGTGGGCLYTGRDMRTAHAGLGIRGKDFGALVQDLQKTLRKFKVPAQEQKELTAVLAPMQKDIVTR